MDDAVLDEGSAGPGVGDDTFDALGKQIADVLRSAHQTAEVVQEHAARDAEEVRVRAREEAEQVADEARQQLEQAASMLEEAREREAIVRAETEAFVRDRHAEIDRREADLTALREQLDEVLPAAITLVAAAQLEAARLAEEHRVARDELANLGASLTALRERQVAVEQPVESLTEIDLRPDAAEPAVPAPVDAADAASGERAHDEPSDDERVEAAVRAAVARAIDISTAETGETGETGDRA